MGRTTTACAVQRDARRSRTVAIHNPDHVRHTHGYHLERDGLRAVLASRRSERTTVARNVMRETSTTQLVRELMPFCAHLDIDADALTAERAVLSLAWRDELCT